MKNTTSIIAALTLLSGSIHAGDTYSPAGSSKQSLLDYPEPTPSENPWEFEFTPYFWLANMKGATAVEGAKSDISIGIDDILKELDFAFMATGGVRYKRVGLFADFLYLDVSPSSSTSGSLYRRVDLRLEHTMFDPKLSYRVLESDDGWLDLLAGARYMDMDLELRLVPGGASTPEVRGSGREQWWDAVGGIRGHYNFSDRVFATGLADIGGGSSDITWQVQAALGYRFSESLSLTAGYRYLHYDYINDDYAWDVETRGAYLGLGFIW